MELPLQQDHFFIGADTSIPIDLLQLVYFVATFLFSLVNEGRERERMCSKVQITKLRKSEMVDLEKVGREVSFIEGEMTSDAPCKRVLLQQGGRNLLL